MVLKNEAQIYEYANLQTEKNKYAGTWLHVNFMFLHQAAFYTCILLSRSDIVSYMSTLCEFWPPNAMRKLRY